eukprot:168686_1
MATAASRLTLYLDDVLVQLNADQVQQIKELIQRTVIYHEIQNDDVENEDGKLSEYVFDVNDTFLHSIFGKIKAEKIKQIVDHKLTVILLVVLGCIAFALEYISSDDRMLVIDKVYDISLYILILIPWLIFKHLMLNRTAFKLCIESFDYWIKVGYGLIWTCAGLLNAHANAVWNGGFTLLIIKRYFGLIVTTLGISYISSFDAEHSNRTKQLVISVFAALLLSFWTINAQFLLKEEDDTKYIIHLSDGIHVISIQSFLAGAARIVCIFFWRQSYLAWRTEGRALSISTAPIITWVDGVLQKDNIAKTIKNNEQNVPQSDHEEMEIPAVAYRQKVPHAVLQPGNQRTKHGSMSYSHSDIENLRNEDSLSNSVRL